MTTKKIRKALNKLNDYIDGEQNRLCDRIHELEVSHNRLLSYLRIFIHLRDDFGMSIISINQKDYDDFHRFIDDVRKEIERKVL